MKKLVAILGVLLYMLPAYSQAVEVPSDQQYSLFIKILSYNRTLDRKFPGSKIRFGLVRQKNDPKSRRSFDSFLEAWENSDLRSLKGKEIQLVPLLISSQTSVQEAMDGVQLDVIYLTPQNGRSLSEWVDWARNKGVLTLSPNPKDCEEGVGVSVEALGKKAGIVINLSAAKTQGANFSSQLLKIARIIEKAD